MIGTTSFGILRYVLHMQITFAILIYIQLQFFAGCPNFHKIKHICELILITRRYISNLRQTVATSGGGTVQPSRAHKFTNGFQLGSCCSIFSFMCSVLEIVVCSFVFFFGHCIVCPSITLLSSSLIIFKLFVAIWVSLQHKENYKKIFFLQLDVSFSSKIITVMDKQNIIPKIRTTHAHQTMC